MIPYARQSITEEDIKAVEDVLRSDWLTQGPMVERFEGEVAAYCGASYAIAVNSATSALHIACLAAGLGPGDLLWTSPNTFVASANCALYCGASVDFVDIDPNTYNISVTSLEQKLICAEKDGRLPKVVLPVHFAGQSCEMEPIAALAERFGFRIIEDASHAIGGSYKGQRIGSCRYADMTVFSFHPVKIITTGEGGMVLTNSAELHARLMRLRSHGITRDPSLMTEEPHGPWYYQQIELGYNYRMSDIQAALGLSQMASLDKFINRRRDLAARYGRELAELPLVLPRQHSDTDSAWHLYVVRLDTAKTDTSRFQIIQELRNSGVFVTVHYIPVYKQPYYSSIKFDQECLKETEKYYNEAFSLPLFVQLSQHEQSYIITTLTRLLTETSDVNNL